MTKIKLLGNEYNLRFTIESWKKLKTECELTQSNLEEKISADSASVLSSMVYYGLSKADREKVTIDDLESDIDLGMWDIVNAAIIEGMPEQARKKVAQMIKNNEDNEESETPEKK